MAKVRNNLDDSDLSFQQRLYVRSMEIGIFKSIYYSIIAANTLNEIIQKHNLPEGTTEFEINEKQIPLQEDELFSRISEIHPDMTRDFFNQMLQQARQNAITNGGKILAKLAGENYEITRECKLKYNETDDLYSLLSALISVYNTLKKEKNKNNLILMEELLNHTFSIIDDRTLTDKQKIDKIFEEMDKIYDGKRNKFFSSFSFTRKPKTERNFQDMLLLKKDKSYQIVSLISDIQSYGTHRKNLKIRHIKHLAGNLPSRYDKKGKQPQSTLPEGSTHNAGIIENLKKNGLDVDALMAYLSTRFSPSFDVNSEAFKLTADVQYDAYVNECHLKNNQFQKFMNMLADLSKLGPDTAKQFIQKINFNIHNELGLMNTASEYNNWQRQKDKENQVGYLMIIIDDGENAEIINDKIAEKIHTTLLSIYSNIIEPTLKQDIGKDNLISFIKIQNENIIENITIIQGIFSAIKQCLMQNMKWNSDWDEMENKDVLRILKSDNEAMKILLQNKTISGKGIDELLSAYDQYSNIHSELNNAAVKMGFENLNDMLDKKFQFIYTSGLYRNVQSANDKLFNTINYYTAAYKLSHEFKHFDQAKVDIDIEASRLELEKIHKEISRQADKERKHEKRKTSASDSMTSETDPVSMIVNQLKDMAISYKDLDRTTHANDIKKLIRDIDTILKSNISNERKLEKIILAIEIAYLEQKYYYIHPFLKQEKSNIDFINRLNKDTNSFHYPRMLGLILQTAYLNNPQYTNTTSHIMDRDSIKLINLPINRVYEKLFPQLSAPQVSRAYVPPEK